MNRSSCIALLALLVLGTYCQQAEAAKVYTVVWARTTYKPLKIKLGDSVKFTWAGGLHGVAQGSCKVYKVLGKLAPAGKVVVKPAKKGTYTYVCQNALHCPIQKLKVIVV